MKLILLVLSVFSVPAFAGFEAITIPTGQRLVWGSETDGVTNLFLSIAGDNKGTSCALNLSLPGPSLAKAFERGHDYQVFYTARYDVEIGKVGFESQLVPYSYEYCAEYSHPQDPEHSECLRYETARGIRSVFSYDLAAFRMEGTLACLNNDVPAGSTPVSEAEAEAFVRKYVKNLVLR